MQNKRITGVMPITGAVISKVKMCRTNSNFEKFENTVKCVRYAENDDLNYVCHS